MAEITEQRLREIVREELHPQPLHRAIPLVPQQTDADQLEALTKPGQASDYNIGWSHGGRTSYVDGEQALAATDTALRGALADMQFPSSVGSSVAGLLLDEMAKIKAVPTDAASQQLWQMEQDRALARIVGPQNVDAAKTAAAQLASKIRDKDFASKLPVKSAAWISQAWLQSQRIAARTGR